MEHRAASGSLARADTESEPASVNLASPLLSRSASVRGNPKALPILQRVGSMREGPLNTRPPGFFCSVGGLVLAALVVLITLSYVGLSRASSSSTFMSMQPMDSDIVTGDEHLTPSDLEGQNDATFSSDYDMDGVPQPVTSSSSSNTASVIGIATPVLPSPSPSPSPPPRPVHKPNPTELTVMTPIVPRDPETPYTFVCPDTSAMRYSINGVAVKPSQLIPTLESVLGPPGSILTLVANGTCGPFVGPSTTFYLRASVKGSDMVSTDISVFRDIYLRNEFKFLKKRLTALPAKKILDLGTNMGLSLIYWATHFPQAQIVGVEPELHNFGLAGLNIAHRPNVWLERAAVTERVGFGSLKSVARGDWGWGAKQEDRVFHAEHGFASVTIPYLMQRFGWDTIDYLKVDIEGTELELCQDILNGAEWINKVQCVTFEMHDRLRPDAVPSIMETCQAALKKARMRFLGHHKVDHLYFWCRK